MAKEFEITKQYELFPKDKLPEIAFQIENDILYDCIGRGRDGIYGKDRIIRGFNSVKGDGYALLVYFAMQVLGVSRLPFCQDRVFTKGLWQQEPFRNFLTNDLTDSVVEEIIHEVRALYDHVQSAFKQKGIKTVNLRREIHRHDGCESDYCGVHNDGYAERIVMLKKSAELLGMEEVEINMDVLNSFGDEGEYWKGLTLRLEIPVTDVLYCSNLIADREGEEKHTVETGEWVVVNRSLTGVVGIPTDSIVVDDKMWRNIQDVGEQEARQFIKEYSPICLEAPYDMLNREKYFKSGIRRTLRHLLIDKICG